MFGFGVSAGGARLPGRRLLDHCFDEFGGGHEEITHNNTAADLDLAAHEGTNWEPVVTGVHADPLVVRLVYWLVYVVAAVLLLVFMLTVWPPPDRVFPRKKPVARVIPWCCMGRMLGYGVIDWREGKLTPYFRYFRERHEVLSLFTGDMNFITFRARLAHLAAGVACTASLSMGLVDLESGRVTGDFWLLQVWVFGALFVFEIVLGIALRVSAVGVSERALAAADKTRSRQIQASYVAVCFAFAACCLATSIVFVHVMDEGGGCGDGLNTFAAYSYVFAIYELFSWLVFHPCAITVRWVLGRVLLKTSADALTDDETMECVWRRIPVCGENVCGCAPQPSAAVDADGCASERVDVLVIGDDHAPDDYVAQPCHGEQGALESVDARKGLPREGLDDDESFRDGVFAYGQTGAPFARRAPLGDATNRGAPFFGSPKPQSGFSAEKRSPDSPDSPDSPVACASPEATKHTRELLTNRVSTERNRKSADAGIDATRRDAEKEKEKAHVLRASLFRQSAAGTERELVLGWRRESSRRKAAAAADLARAASAARREALDLRTALAEAEAAEAEAAAAAAAAEAAAAAARAAAAEAKALRDALPRRRAAAPEMQPPTPQSIVSTASFRGSRVFRGSATPSTPTSAGGEAGGFARSSGGARNARATAGSSGGSAARDGFFAGRPPRPSPSPSPGTGTAASPWSRLMASRGGGRAASGTPETPAGTASPQERRGDDRA